MEQPPLSEEQIKEHEVKMTEFYERRLPFMRLQHEFETKRADIIEANLRVMSAQSQMAQFQFQQEEAQKRDKQPTDASDKS